MHQVILKNGSVIPLSIWQKQKGLSGTQVAKNLSLNGDPQLKDQDGGFCMSELVIEVVQRYREKKGKPVIINSGCRTVKEQQRIKAEGSQAASVSPHIPGMAIDVDTVSKEESKQAEKLLKESAKELGIKIRVGIMQYLRKGSTFVHVDVCPEYYALGKPYHNIPHPKAWEIEQEW